MNSEIHPKHEEQPAILVAPSTQREQAVKQIAFRFVAFQAAIGAASLTFITLVPILCVALGKAGQEPDALDSAFLTLSYMVVVLWPVVAVLSLHCLDFEFRILCWGAHWRGVRWARIVGTSITIILVINSGFCGFFASRLLWKLAVVP